MKFTISEEMAMDQYAVIGNPISHSKSPYIHGEFAKQTGEKIQYIAIEAPLDDFKGTVNAFRKRGGKGLNITLPFKQQAFAYVDNCSKEAKLAGAVNTMVFHEDGSTYGHNTDGIGLVRDITINQKYALSGKRLLILGAGGAVRGVLAPLLSQNPHSIIIANRTPEKAVNLADEFSDLGNISASSYEKLSNKSFDVIINGTSASLHNQLPSLPVGMITTDSYCYDMAYSSQLTEFLKWVKTLGVVHYNDGWGMLVEQAAEAFFLWRGVRPETRSLLAAC